MQVRIETNDETIDAECEFENEKELKDATDEIEALLNTFKTTKRVVTRRPKDRKTSRKARRRKPWEK